MAKTTVPIELSSTPSIVDNGNATAITIDSNENVGIGTSSPATALDITGTVTADSLTVDGASGDLRFTGGTGQDIVWGSAAIDYAAIRRIDPAAQDVGISFHTTTNAGVDGAPERMRIDQSGNVGIGTSSPADELHVNGSGDTSIRVTTSSTSLEPKLVFVDGSGDYASLEKVNRDIKIRAFNTDVAYFTNGGSVGIGTSSPAQLLHLKSATPAIEFDDSGFATVRGRIYSNEGNLLLEADYNNSRASSNIAFNVDGSEAMRISGGNVGIGTSSPSTKLTVASASFEDHILLERTGVGSMHITATNPHGLAFTDGTTQFITLVQSTGNVGIGTTSPSGVLHVKGSGNELYLERSAHDIIALGIGTANGLKGLHITNVTDSITPVSLDENAPAASLVVNSYGNVKAKAYSSDYIALYNIAAGSYTAGTWYDFTDRLTINNYGYGDGMYIFRVFDDTYGAGGGNYFVNYLSEPFWFYNVGSNSSGGMEFTISGVAMGHAANGVPGGNQIRIRLLENFGGVAHDFQWSPGSNNLTLDQTGGKTIHIYLYKWGGI